jgi:hypothetical protein
LPVFKHSASCPRIAKICGWHVSLQKKLGNSLLTVWTIIKMNPHKKAVFARTQHAMNMDFVCWHELFQGLQQTFDPLRRRWTGSVDVDAQRYEIAADKAPGKAPAKRTFQAI